MGWLSLVTVPFLLIGLLKPEATFYFFMVMPFPARWFVWRCWSSRCS